MTRSGRCARNRDRSTLVSPVHVKEGDSRLEPRPRAVASLGSRLCCRRDWVVQSFFSSDAEQPLGPSGLLSSRPAPGREEVLPATLALVYREGPEKNLLHPERLAAREQSTPTFRADRSSKGLPALRFHHLRYTVLTLIKQRRRRTWIIHAPDRTVYRFPPSAARTPSRTIRSSSRRGNPRARIRSNPCGSGRMRHFLHGSIDRPRLTEGERGTEIRRSSPMYLHRAGLPPNGEGVCGTRRRAPYAFHELGKAVLARSLTSAYGSTGSRTPSRTSWSPASTP